MAQGIPLEERVGKTDLDHDLKMAYHLHMTGRFESAENLYGKILRIEPDHADALHLTGLIALGHHHYEKAESLIKKAIKKAPNISEYHHSMGTIYKCRGKMDKALAAYMKAFNHCPENADALYEAGNILYKKGRLKKSEDCMKKVLSINKGHTKALFRLATLYTEKKNHPLSNECLEKLLKIKPDTAKALNNMGLNYKAMGDLNIAVRCFERAIEKDPTLFQAWCNMGITFQETERFDQSLNCLKKAIQLNPEYASAHYNMGVGFWHLGRAFDAISCFNRALELDPEMVSAYNNKGIVLQHLGNIQAAKRCFKRAVAIEPLNTKAWHNLGVVHAYTESFHKAICCEKKALDADPLFANAWVFYRDLLIQTGAWDKADAISQQVRQYTHKALEKEKVPCETPFQNIVRVMDPEENFRVARAWSKALEKRAALAGVVYTFDDRMNKEDKLTIGYLSNNFRDHPTSHLIGGLFRDHDRKRFSVNCYSYGEDDRSDVRKTIMASCDRFVDIKDMDDVAASKQIFDDHVDVLVDLKGHTACNRMGICALRPAPVTARYLGMAGTTGADFFDYLITDKIVTPEKHASCYSESFVYMPDCYQVNDREQKKPACKTRRRDHGLPEKGFVFGCFGTNYKVDRAIVGAWISILKKTPDSVLWILQRSRRFRENIKSILNKQGVGSGRVVFADPLPREAHLERLLHCDLVLDTRIINGAATTSDALWAGVPVLTVKGRHFASRMSASILSCMGLDELVAGTLEAYEKTAVQIAENRQWQKRLKQRIEKHIATGSLFNTRCFAGHLESAFEMMMARSRSGGRPSIIELGSVRP